MKAARLLLLLIVVGGVSTGLWLGTMQFPEFEETVFSPHSLTALAICILMTTLNLAGRWFRWHFLIRRFSRSVGTRDSLLIYFATLPTIVTPFCVGELLRVFLLRKAAPGAVRHLVRVWVIERAMDVATLLSFFLLTRDRTLAWPAIGLIALVCYGALRWVLLRNGRRLSPILIIGALSVTVVSWLLPVSALFVTLNLLSPVSSTVPFADALRTFSAGTLIGGVTGLPLGVFVTGSEMILELTSAAVSSNVAISSILIFRVGTAWFAVCLGIAVFILRAGRLKDISRAAVSKHFDTLAPEYTEELPEHVRNQLLKKKVGFIRARLEQNNILPGAVGLDVGCGHGWYLAEFVRAGYKMIGLDYSTQQLVEGNAYLRKENLPTVLVHGDAQSLPFPDNSFDYVYSINAIHHILSTETQTKALSEIVRVLRPGGLFLLNEMNTSNYLFLFYMSYLFPLIHRIDQGDEHWILPTALPPIPGGKWLDKVDYFTFIPDFFPRFLHAPLRRIERYLERSRMGRYSAHYQAVLVKKSSIQSDGGSEGSGSE